MVKIILQLVRLNFCWVQNSLLDKDCLQYLFVLFDFLVTQMWNFHSTFGSKVLKERLWILNCIVFGTFADLDRYPDLRHNRLVKF